MLTVAPVVAGPMCACAGTERKHGHGMGQQDWENGYAIAVPFAFKPSHFTRGKDGAPADIAAPLSADADRGDQEQVVAFADAMLGDGRIGRSTLRADRVLEVYSSMAVRRLTPREAERLQGFPDDYTLIPYRGKPAADGPRYRALGNSWAVNCARWVARRIEMVEGMMADGACLDATQLALTQRNE